jgi:hypothetical protein
MDIGAKEDPLGGDWARLYPILSEAQVPSLYPPGGDAGGSRVQAPESLGCEKDKEKESVLVLGAAPTGDEHRVLRGHPLSGHFRRSWFPISLGITRPAPLS